jgi:hypothetical protein
MNLFAPLDKLRLKVQGYVKAEPVRVAIHAVALSGLAYLVAAGKLDSNTGNLVAAAVGYVLLGAGVEVARAQVTPVKE